MINGVVSRRLSYERRIENDLEFKERKTQFNKLAQEKRKMKINNRCVCGKLIYPASTKCKKCVRRK